VWGEVSRLTGSGALGASHASAGAGTGKVLGVTALLGAPVTVGLALALLHLAGGGAAMPTGAARVLSSHPALAESAEIVAQREPGVVEAPVALAHAPVTTGTLPAAAPPARLVALRKAVPQAPDVPAAAGDEASLAREANLVAQARQELREGDAQGCLSTVASAQAVPSPQLGPEELTLRMLALRKLGRNAEADQVDATLRLTYPASALVR
jgi:hypothetical protein